MTILQEIYNWSKNLPLWQQDAIRRLYTDRTLSDADLEDLCAMAKAVHSKEIRADYHDAIPLNRYGLEEELAESIFFLCSDKASYITGQVLAVDGGFDAVGIGLATLRREQHVS